VEKQVPVSELCWPDLWLKEKLEVPKVIKPPKYAVGDTIVGPLARPYHGEDLRFTLEPGTIDSYDESTETYSVKFTLLNHCVNGLLESCLHPSTVSLSRFYLQSFLPGQYVEYGSESGFVCIKSFDRGDYQVAFYNDHLLLTSREQTGTTKEDHLQPCTTEFRHFEIEFFGQYHKAFIRRLYGKSVLIQLTAPNAHIFQEFNLENPLHWKRLKVDKVQHRDYKRGDIVLFKRKNCIGFSKHLKFCSGTLNTECRPHYRPCGSSPTYVVKASCLSAVHAGAITDQGGFFGAQNHQFTSYLVGSNQNGIQSHGTYDNQGIVHVCDFQPLPGGETLPETTEALQREKSLYGGWISQIGKNVEVKINQSEKFFVCADTLISGIEWLNKKIPKALACPKPSPLFAVGDKVYAPNKAQIPYELEEGTIHEVDTETNRYSIAFSDSSIVTGIYEEALSQFPSNLKVRHQILVCEHDLGKMILALNESSKDKNTKPTEKDLPPPEPTKPATLPMNEPIHAVVLTALQKIRPPGPPNVVTKCKGCQQDITFILPPKPRVAIGRKIICSRCKRTHTVLKDVPTLQLM